MVEFFYRIDLNYCRANPFINNKVLKNEIICQALVSSITTFDNSVSLPVSAEYSSKNGKTAANNKNILTNRIKVIQICENCQKRAKSNDLIFSEESIAKCVSDCNVCYNEKVVCERCTEKRPYKYCS